jgi:FtsH-binding integral membrane protein
MGIKTLLRKGASAVTFLFTMFGGFFIKVAPPEEVDAGFAVGIASFCVLIALLFVSSMKPSRRKKHTNTWLKIAGFAALVGVTAGCVYKYSLDRLTFAWPPDSKNQRFVAGSVLTPRAQVYQREHPAEGNSEMVADFGGITQRELVWTASSIEQAKALMLGTYLLMVLGLATGIFCLIEQSAGNLR